MTTIGTNRHINITQKRHGPDENILLCEDLYGPQRAKCRVPSDPLLATRPRTTCTPMDLHNIPHSQLPNSGNNTNVHQLTNGYTDCEISRQWNIHWQLNKEKEVPTYATTRMNPENVILSEQDWPRRTAGCTLPLYEMPTSK